jgi:protease I
MNEQVCDMQSSPMKVAILVEDFHDMLQFWVPYYRLVEAGISVKVVSREPIHLSENALPGRYASAPRDMTPAEARNHDFTCVVIPGGYAPDYLRADADMLALVRDIHSRGGLVAAIERGAWVLISAGLVAGRRMACSPAVVTDLANAKAVVTEDRLVTDGNLITARALEDLPAFCGALVAELSRRVTPATA